MTCLVVMYAARRVHTTVNVTAKNFLFKFGSPRTYIKMTAQMNKDIEYKTVDIQTIRNNGIQIGMLPFSSSTQGKVAKSERRKCIEYC